ncbi:hypothetical protein CROQUDRAFT_90004 [Cronartium quercuum f. sp. fusiforme G11]|uniref:Uncharacterized protein n=1 Tax=Cronartium quercuum f. sp. fusiforme G11 TaxID=708437 RepID=A0A9P6TDS1_9BASI|nr:hypothetical protein CROQUDRAFT_90004 [Cronartium quercuum f. sp. fusiforme G11]
MKFSRLMLMVVITVNSICLGFEEIPPMKSIQKNVLDGELFSSSSPLLKPCITTRKKHHLQVSTKKFQNKEGSNTLTIAPRKFKKQNVEKNIYLEVKFGRSRPSSDTLLPVPHKTTSSCAGQSSGNPAQSSLASKICNFCGASSSEAARKDLKNSQTIQNPAQDGLLVGNVIISHQHFKRKQKKKKRRIFRTDTNFHDAKPFFTHDPYHLTNTGMPPHDRQNFYPYNTYNVPYWGVSTGAALQYPHQVVFWPSFIDYTLYIPVIWSPSNGYVSSYTPLYRYPGTYESFADGGPINDVNPELRQHPSVSASRNTEFAYAYTPTQTTSVNSSLDPRASSFHPSYQLSSQVGREGDSSIQEQNKEVDCSTDGTAVPDIGHSTIQNIAGQSHHVSFPICFSNHNKAMENAEGASHLLSKSDHQTITKPAFIPRLVTHRDGKFHQSKKPTEGNEEQLIGNHLHPSEPTQTSQEESSHEVDVLRSAETYQKTPEDHPGSPLSWMFRTPETTTHNKSPLEGHWEHLDEHFPPLPIRVSAENSGINLHMRHAGHNTQSIGSVSGVAPSKKKIQTTVEWSSMSPPIKSDGQTKAVVLSKMSDGNPLSEVESQSHVPLKTQKRYEEVSQDLRNVAGFEKMKTRTSSAPSYAQPPKGRDPTQWQKTRSEVDSIMSERNSKTTQEALDEAKDLTSFRLEKDSIVHENLTGVKHSETQSLLGEPEFLDPISEDRKGKKFDKGAEVDSGIGVDNSSLQRKKNPTKVDLDELVFATSDMIPQDQNPPKSVHQRKLHSKSSQRRKMTKQRKVPICTNESPELPSTGKGYLFMNSLKFMSSSFLTYFLSFSSHLADLVKKFTPSPRSIFCDAEGKNKYSGFLKGWVSKYNKLPTENSKEDFLSQASTATNELKIVDTVKHHETWRKAGLNVQVMDTLYRTLQIKNKEKFLPLHITTEDHKTLRSERLHFELGLQWIQSRMKTSKTEFNRRKNVLALQCTQYEIVNKWPNIRDGIIPEYKTFLQDIIRLGELWPTFSDLNPKTITSSKRKLDAIIEDPAGEKFLKDVLDSDYEPRICVLRYMLDRPSLPIWWKKTDLQEARQQGVSVEKILFIGDQLSFGNPNDTGFLSGEIAFITTASLYAYFASWKPENSISPPVSWSESPEKAWLQKHPQLYQLYQQQMKLLILEYDKFELAKEALKLNHSNLSPNQWWTLGDELLWKDQELPEDKMKNIGKQMNLKQIQDLTPKKLKVTLSNNLLYELGSNDVKKAREYFEIRALWNVQAHQM